MADYVNTGDKPNVLVEPTTNRDGSPVGATVNTQIVLLGRNPSDGRVDTFDPSTLIPATPAGAGTYGYAAGTSTGTVDVPSTARLQRVSVLANTSSITTLTIGGGATITLPAGASFDEQIPGTALGADVVIGGGAPRSYYVSWVA